MNEHAPRFEDFKFPEQLGGKVGKFSVEPNKNGVLFMYIETNVFPILPSDVEQIMNACKNYLETKENNK